MSVVAGTDAGGWLHGNNAQEITCLVQAGLSPMEALRSATGRAARCLGLERSIGTVERGKLADLVLVDVDPLADPASLEHGQSVRLVMKEGKVAVNRL